MKKNKTLELVLKAIDDKKGEMVEAIDVSELTPFASYYVLTNANNIRQINAIKEAVVETLEKNKINIHHVEGKEESGWVLVDAYDVVVNIFSKEERERINLDQLLTRKK